MMLTHKRLLLAGLIIPAVALSAYAIFSVVSDSRDAAEMGPMYAVGFSPDSKHVFAGGQDGVVWGWNVDTGDEVWHFKSEGSITGVAVSPDGQHVAFGYETLHYCNWTTRKEDWRFSSFGGRITALAFSPDGKKLAMGGSGKTLICLDAATGTKPLALSGHQADVNCVAFSADGSLLLSGGGDFWGGQVNDPCVRLWDLESGKELRRFQASGPVYGVGFCCNGRLAVAGSQGQLGIQVWDLKTGDQVRHFGEESEAMCVTPNGKQVLAACRLGALQLWDIESGHLVHDFGGQLTPFLHAVGISNDGRYAASCSGYFAPGSRSTILGLNQGVPAASYVRLFDLKSGGEVRRFDKVPGR